MNRNYTIVELVQGWISSWSRLLGAFILGGCIGFLFSLTIDPVYEASAYIQVSIDDNRAFIPDDYTVRQAYEKVRLIFLADETLQEVVQGHETNGGISPSFSNVAEFRSNIKLTQRREGFQLYVYAESPSEASQLAARWGEIALREMAEATRHAIRAGEYQSALYGAWCRISTRQAQAADQMIWICQTGEGHIDPEGLEAGILNEVQLSRGILPVFTYSWAEKPTGSVDPIRWDTGWLVLCGALLGIVLAAIIQTYRDLSEGGAHTSQ